MKIPHDALRWNRDRRDKPVGEGAAAGRASVDIASSAASSCDSRIRQRPATFTPANVLSRSLARSQSSEHSKYSAQSDSG